MRGVGFGVTIMAFLLVACGGATTSSVDRGAGDAGGSDAEADAGFTRLNGAKCCVEGTGRTCCAEGESERACDAYGGAVGHCSKAGEPFGTKATCALCCPGMRPIDTSEVAPDGSCTVTAVDSRVCAPCGDGVCSAAAGENRCSCPMDCP